MKYPLLAMNARIGEKDDLKKSKFIFEPKVDGIRALCFVNKKMKFISRNEKDITKDYPELEFRKQIKADSCVLDGEIVAFDKNGVPKFGLLQRGHEAHYIVFDILSLNNKRLVQVPLIERKEILDEVVKDGNRIEKIIYTTKGEVLWKEMVERGFEGVMAKEKNSIYYSGERKKIWLKIKTFKSIDPVIIGYTKKKRILSSLAVGLYDKSNLYYIGKVGTGFTEKLIKELHSKLKKIEVKSLKLKNEGEHESAIKNIQWVKPKYVCEVKYLEFTKYGILRQPAFVRLRSEKGPKDATFKDQAPEILDKLKR